jgi:hypothetical protein
VIVDTADLTILTEIAEIAGVRPSAVCNWKNRYPDFPAPVAEIHGIELYHLPAMLDWLRWREKITA